MILLGLITCLPGKSIRCSEHCLSVPAIPSLISGESSLPSITHAIQGPFVFSKVYYDFEHRSSYVVQTGLKLTILPNTLDVLALLYTYLVLFAKNVQFAFF